MKKICFVDDSEDLQKLVKLVLQDWFQVYIAGSIYEAQVLLKKEKFDLLLLDVSLPDGSGFDFCTELRKNKATSDLPIIFLTAKSDPIDKLMGFSIGADDYLVKPFEPLELKARIQARLKKNQNKGPEDLLNFGSLKFDLIKRRVSLAKEERSEDLSLTPFEFKILYFLVSHSGKFFTRTELLQHVMTPGVHVNEDNIYTHISALRKKLSSESVILESVPRIGYRVIDPQKINH